MSIEAFLRGKLPELRNPIETLKIWSKNQDKKWLRQIINEVLDKKRILHEEELNSIYLSFLVENGLAEEERQQTNTDVQFDEKEVISSTMEEKEPIKELIIESISAIEGVNALIPHAEIEFSPNLTVIYGGNATGKSGYARIFKRISNSRTTEDIWSNIYKEHTKNRCKAKFHYKTNGDSRQFDWNGEREVPPFTLIDVFDNKCVKVFLTEKLGFGFNPYGFEYFSIISDCINAIKDKLNLEIMKNNIKKDFSELFNKDSKVYSFIRSISYDSKEADLRSLAVFDSESSKNLEEKEKAREEVKASSIKVQVLRTQKRQIENIKSIIERIENCFNDLKLEEYKKIIEDHIKILKDSNVINNLSLSSYNIPFQESLEWKKFLESAEEYIKLLPNHEHYPGSNDKCLYCRQNLDEKAMEVIQTYRKLLSSETATQLKEIEQILKTSHQELNSVNLSFPELSEEDKETLTNLLDSKEINLMRKIEDYCGSANAIRKDILNALDNKKWNKIEFFKEESLVVALDTLIQTLNGEITKLSVDKEEREEILKGLEAEINELKDRRILSERKDEVVEYLVKLKWVKKAQEVNRTETTRPITELSKKVWDELITDTFKEKFEQERKKLGARTVDFTFPGEAGVTKRSKTMEGLENIDDFLSEGEQKAIAIADFLAEISIKEQITPVVFDDPVTSFDHVRREIIAKRFIEESRRRQVIIFTHDILFLFYLYNNQQDTLDASFHWVVSNVDGIYGRLALGDCPASDCLGLRIKKVQDSLSKGARLGGSERADEISRGFENLRAAYEHFVMEKLFRKVVVRYDERMKMHLLEKVKFDQDLPIKIMKKHNELSKFIEAHSHSDVVLQTLPTIETLKDELIQLTELISSNK